ncbi:low-specificity L-threonine aldolase [Thermoflexibacter ruber]|uniref:L-threonine aldolase n=1 Tax=Thermoflexibacter ruber TaxID=1003 RepID=A0A1I2IGJ4_9BACT|nr:low-specificity L-threonine aldolase [Thermoflexibacter ruber]SFF41512.1 L-threonine aldolase [Thermoflexibacter ruber]
MRFIDLRSDTVTKPTPAMLEAMFHAEVGDDVYGEDPSVNALEQKVANLFGKEAALFCPSGTMTNQIAIRILTQPQEEVICDRMAHIYNYEAGGIMANSHASVRLIHSSYGKFTPEDVLENINPDDIHFPPTALVALENTVNKGGGCYYNAIEIEAISKLSKEKGLKMHLDGARIFNALVATSEKAEVHGKYFDTISVCFSKGLGAPVGSALLGTEEHIKKAKRVRKLFGGGMRQAGYLAAAAIYALDNHIERLADDHRRAKTLAETLAELPYIAQVVPVYTNIVIFQLIDNLSPADFSAWLKAQGILANPFSKQSIRMVTHLDFDDAMLEKVVKVLKSY